MLRPRAIAVVGASDDPVKIGGRPLALLLRHGYGGRVFPVNPARATDATAAEEALRGLRIGPLWDGVRGSAPLDLPAAVDLLQRLGDAARSLAGAVAEIDLNPVAVGRHGEGVTILDALVRR